MGVIAGYDRHGAALWHRRPHRGSDLLRVHQERVVGCAVDLGPVTLQIIWHGVLLDIWHTFVADRFGSPRVNLLLRRRDMPNNSFPTRRISPRSWAWAFSPGSYWASLPGLSPSSSCPAKTRAGSLSRSSSASPVRSSAVFLAASSVSGRSSPSTSAGF